MRFDRLLLGLVMFGVAAAGLGRWAGSDDIPVGMVVMQSVGIGFMEFGMFAFGWCPRDPEADGYLKPAVPAVVFAVGLLLVAMTFETSGV